MIWSNSIERKGHGIFNTARQIATTHRNTKKAVLAWLVEDMGLICIVRFVGVFIIRHK